MAQRKYIWDMRGKKVDILKPYKLRRKFNGTIYELYNYGNLKEQKRIAKILNKKGWKTKIVKVKNTKVKNILYKEFYNR